MYIDIVILQNHAQTNPDQSQTLLMSAEKFGLLLAKFLNETGMLHTFESENIGMYT